MTIVGASVNHIQNKPSQTKDINVDKISLYSVLKHNNNTWVYLDCSTSNCWYLCLICDENTTNNNNNNNIRVKNMYHYVLNIKRRRAIQVE